MEMQKLYLLVPLAPLVGAIIAGLFCRVIPRWVAHTVTTGGVAIACHRVVRDLQGRDGRQYLQRPGVSVAVVWGLSFRGGFPDRSTDGHHDAGGHLRFPDGAYLHHRLHAGRSWLQPFLQLHCPVYVLHVDARDEQQLHAALLWLGGRRPGFLSADRFLVYPADGDLRQPESIPGQPRRGLRFHPGHRPGACPLRYSRLRCRFCQGAGSWPAAYHASRCLGKARGWR
jgi:hypothetical protein